MANVSWAKDFYERVTASLPDLLTKHGEGKELEALDELRTELGKEAAEARALRKVALEKELAEMNGSKPEGKPEEAPTAAEAPKAKR